MFGDRPPFSNGLVDRPPPPPPLPQGLDRALFITVSHLSMTLNQYPKNQCQSLKYLPFFPQYFDRFNRSLFQLS